jgi:hypothetical protein
LETRGAHKTHLGRLNTEVTYGVFLSDQGRAIQRLAPDARYLMPVRFDFGGCAWCSDIF